MLLFYVLWLDDTLTMSTTLILMENYEKCHHFEFEKKSMTFLKFAKISEHRKSTILINGHINPLPHRDPF